MAYDPKAIANYFLAVAAEQNKSLTPMKIQKLVYFANGWHLAIKGEPLINEQVEAWRFGPVIASLYGAFRRFGDQPITGRADHTVTEFHDTWTISRHRFQPSLDDIPDQADFTRDFLDRIWTAYGGYTAIQLSNETHRADSPWDIVSKKYNGVIPKRTDIPPELIKEYFQSLARQKVTAQ
jgi:uncharacterized phage-associated protein